MKKRFARSKIKARKSKKAQLAIFVIIAILIVALIAIILFFRRPFPALQIPSEVKMINFAVEECLKQASEDGLYIQGLRGGPIMLTTPTFCRAVKMYQIVAGSLFEYNAKNCVFYKTLSKINETEPPEMRELLEGKSMRCSYTRGNFNENWIKTLSVDIEACTGELKDALEELIFAI